jgi:DNA ligase-1
VAVADAAELEALEASFVGLGHEGVIVRQPRSLYKFGRASKTKGELVKIKRFVDFEAKVVGVYEENHNANTKVTNALGRSERSSHAAGKVGKGTLGGLVLVAINGPSEGIEFRCGTGFDAAERAALWSEWHDTGAFIGRVVKVRSFPIGVKDRPRHPVYVGVRSTLDL